MSITELTSAIDRPLVLCGAHGRTGEGGWFDAVLLDVARRADQAAAAPLRAEGIGRATCECLLVDAGAILVHGSYLGGGVGQDEEDGDRRPGEDDGGEDLHCGMGLDFLFARWYLRVGGRIWGLL